MGGTCCREHTPENSITSNEAEKNGNNDVRIYGNFSEEATLGTTTDTKAGPLPNVAVITDEKIDYDHPQLKNAIKSQGDFQEKDNIIKQNKHAELIGPYKYKHDGSLYFGQYSGRNRSGYGEAILNTGLYQGQWKDDMPTGFGRLLTIKGCIYQGHFLEGLYHGKGFYLNSEGNKYEGQFKKGVKEGQGKEENEDGSVYIGHFSKNMKNGQGMFEWKDGSTYKGDFVNNDLHGIGVYKWADGRVYDGDWLNSSINGFGTFNWPDGRKYTGSFINHKKEGYGEYTWPNGKTIKGQWKNNKLEGQAEVIDKLGNSSVAEFSNNKPVHSATNSVSLNTVRFDHVSINLSNLNGNN